VLASASWQDLNDNLAMDWTFDGAEDADAAMAGWVELSLGVCGRSRGRIEL
jgi:hypothetical protein